MNNTTKSGPLYIYDTTLYHTTTQFSYWRQRVTYARLLWSVAEKTIDPFNQLTSYSIRLKFMQQFTKAHWIKCFIEIDIGITDRRAII